MNSKNNMNDIPNTSYTLGNMYTYDYRIHKWIYDVKYYLNDNNWCMDQEGKDIIREAREQELEMVRLHQEIIDKQERENAAWLAHKKCRKQSCVCKRCEKYCYCYDCAGKISSCSNLVQE